MPLIFRRRHALFALILRMNPHNTINPAGNQRIPLINIMWRCHNHLMTRPKISEIPFILKRQRLFLLGYVCSISFTVIIIILLNKCVDIIFIICFFISLVGIRPVHWTLFVKKSILLFVHELWSYCLLTKIGCINNFVSLDMHVLLIGRNICSSIL